MLASNEKKNEPNDRIAKVRKKINVKFTHYMKQQQNPAKNRI